MSYDDFRDIIYNKFTYEEAEKYDADLANALDDNINIFYSFSYKLSPWNNEEIKIEKRMPILRKKINDIILNSSGQYDFYHLKIWTYQDTKAELLNKWLNNEKHKLYYYRFSDIIEDFSQPFIEKYGVLKYIEDLIASYTLCKSHALLGHIYKAFLSVSPENLNKACEIINKSTPAIKVCLLYKSDIQEKYLIEGLKALSKIKTTRDINPINFDLLNKLGPKSRLNAIKQLLRMNNRLYHYYSFTRDKEHYNFQYYKDRLLEFIQSNPILLDPLPSVEDLEQFLFPCIIKHNKEVSDIINFYKFILTAKGLKGGE